MNSKGIVALTDHTVCMKCLKKKATHTYVISNRGYGSSFDLCSTHFQFCDDCHKDEYYTWVGEQPAYKEYSEEYQFEDNISDLINSLPLESKELFYNSFGGEYYLEPQDWIDYQLNELLHDKCKEYGMYSPQEIKAYQDRFPTCNNVFLKTYSDGSSHCKCEYDAYGNKDGSCDCNISDECYQCTMYAPRVDKMKEINEPDEFVHNETQRLQDMLVYATTRLGALKLGYDSYIERFGE